MILRSIHNHRNFFSDYWLGTLLTARTGVGPRLAAAELRKRMRRLVRLIDALGGVSRQEPARFRERFARPLLSDVFDFTMADEAAAQPIHRLYPTDEPGAAVALVYLAADASNLERRSVRQELERALEAEGLDHGMILSPERLRLIRRAGDGPRHSALDIALTTLRELEDDESLSAGYRILSARSFVPGPDGRRAIDVLEAESREHSARVSSELKGAVFSAAEMIVGAFQQDVASRPTHFGEHPPILAQVRDAGFLALYRLLFILYAESRDERLANHSLYRDSYGVDLLVHSLLSKPPEQLAGNRTRLWTRLQALFRVFNDGLSPNLPNLENIPPRGGRLFSETTPEGALLTRLLLNDRMCADILLAIATTRPRRGVGRERVSFRELEIEQLGSVYEGLLEYEPAVADQLRLVVRVANREMVLTPNELQFLAQRKNLPLSGDASLVLGTTAERLHRDNVPDDDDEDEGDEPDQDDDVEEEEAVSIKSGQPIRLIRRLEPGTFYFRPGLARKASGSFYTPTPMVDFLVREALDPVIANRTAAEIEQVRVVDLACGSAHFLVGAARYLGAHLHDAYREERGDDPPDTFLPAGSARTALRARWATEGLAWCKRRIVERCLYGVDLNPAAVQLAQVALWIESLAGDRPLSFFAHHIRVGNSLQGTFAHRFDSPPDPRLAVARRDVLTLGLFESNIRQRIEAALDQRRLIDAELPPEVRPDTPEEFRYKEERLHQSEAALSGARLLMDLRCAAPYVGGIWPDLPELVGAANLEGVIRQKRWWPEFDAVRARERFFHWELEFPEVLLRKDRPGFDVVLGNPPWDKVLPSKTEFYATVDPLVIAFKGNDLDQRIRQLHRAHAGLEHRFETERERTTTFARVLRKGGDFPLAKPTADDENEDDAVPRQRKKSDNAAHEDLSKYFVDRSLRLAREGGTVGLVVPSVVYNGDGCVGIRQFLLDKTEVRAFYGFENRKRIFPIHAMYKFANVAALLNPDGAGEFDAAFMRHDVTELSDAGPKPWLVRVTRDELERLSPETLAFLEYRGPRDQEIVHRMSNGRPTLGASRPGAWGTRLISWRQHEIIYNASEDKDLFTIPGNSRLHSPESVLGEDYPRDPQALIAAMTEVGYWPVYEGKQIEQYLVAVKPVRWWLSVDQTRAKYQRLPREAPTLVFRETASNTNQRTCIAAVLPARSAAAHTCTAAEFDHVDPASATIVLNSFCFDFLLRLRAAGTHVSFTYILPVAVPPASVVQGLPRIRTRFAPSQGITLLSQDKSAWADLWTADRAVAEAYSIGPDDFAHILDSFTVWRRKRPGITAFYEARLEDWRREP